MNDKYKSLILAALLIAVVYTVYDKYCDASLNSLETYEDIQDNNFQQQVENNNVQQQLPTNQVKAFEEEDGNMNINNSRPRRQQ